MVARADASAVTYEARDWAAGDAVEIRGVDGAGIELDVVERGDHRDSAGGREGDVVRRAGGQGVVARSAVLGDAGGLAREIHQRVDGRGIGARIGEAQLREARGGERIV